MGTSLRPTELTTAHVAVEGQHEHWQQILSRSLYPLRVHPLSRTGGLWARFRGVSAGPGRLTRGVLGPVRTELSAATAGDAGGQHLELSLQLRHPRLVAVPTGVVQVPAGHLVVHTGDRATTYEHHRRDDVVLLSVPLQELTTSRRQLAEVRLRPLPLPDPARSVLLAAAAQFVRPDAGLDETAAHRYLLAVAERVVRSVAGVEVDLQETGPARRQQAVDHMSAHLHDADLDPAAVAAALGMSRRSLYTLFAGGPGVAETLQRLRVDRAQELLIDPTCANWSIRRIARAVGFTDRSHFSRVFVRHTGHTPSDARVSRRT